MRRFFQILIFIGPLLGIGCGERVTDVSSQPEYAPFIGKEFTTKVDLLLVKYADSKKEFNFSFTDKLNRPDVKKPLEFPIKLAELTVYGIVPKGTKFRVERINGVKAIEFSMVDFHTKITSPGEFEGYSVN